MEKANQASLFSDMPDRVPWLRDEVPFAFSLSQEKILKDIMRLYNAGQAFDLDCTESPGFWGELPKPKQLWHLRPALFDPRKRVGVLPFENYSLRSVVFEAITLIHKDWGITLQQYFHDAVTKEFWRVLMRDGILVVKCQDANGIWSQLEWRRITEKRSFTLIDLFILGDPHMLVAPDTSDRVTLRNYSYFLVFRLE